MASAIAALLCIASVPHHAQGASFAVAARSVTNTYDNVFRLLKEETDDGTDLTEITYGYDKANNRLSKATQVNGAVTETGNYDFTYRITPGISRHGTGRLNQLGLVFDENGLITFYEYDDNGNRTKTIRPGKIDTYTYDRENRLIALDKNSPGGVGAYAYTYDYRTRRVVRDESAAGGVKTNLTFSGGLSVQEFDTATGALGVTLVRGSDYGGGVGGMLYSVRGATASYAHSNARGDITTKTDDSGAVTWQAAYEADGTRTDGGDSEFAANADRQRGNTKDEDPTGLLNEGFRYRDLEAGVFLTRDPAGFVDGPNLYAYVRQNPWSSFDPLGLETRKVGKYTIKGKGHHPVTVESMQRHNMHPTLAEELDGRTMSTKHPHGSAGHKHYNKLEGGIVDKKVAALKKGGVKIDKSAKMTQAQAKKIADQLVGAVKNTDDKYVKWFLGAVKTKEAGHIAKHGTLIRLKMHVAAGTKAPASLLSRAAKYLPKNSAILKTAQVGGRLLTPAFIAMEGFGRHANAQENYPSDAAVYGEKAAGRMRRERYGSLGGRTTEETTARRKGKSDAFFDWLTK